MAQYQGLQYNDTATATLAGLKQDIYFLGKCNAQSISDGDMNRIINKYYAQAQETIREINENFYLTVATADLAIGDGSYNWPDGTSAPAYQKVKSIWAAFTPNDITAPKPEEFVRAQSVDPDSIVNPAYTYSPESSKSLIFGDYFVLLPLVTDATRYPVKNGVKIYYVPTLDKLTSDTDKPKLFPDLHDVITYGALIEVHDRLGNDKKKSDAQAMFKKRMNELKAYASNHIPIELGIVEGQEEAGGWEFPYGFNSMA